MLVEQLLQSLIQLGAKATLLHVALQLPDKAAIVGGQAKDEPAVERVHAAGRAAEEGEHEDHEAAVEHIELWPRHIVGQPAEGKMLSPIRVRLVDLRPPHAERADGHELARGVVAQQRRGKWHQQKGDAGAGTHQQVNSREQLTASVLQLPEMQCCRIERAAVQQEGILQRPDQRHQLRTLAHKYEHLEQRRYHLHAVHQRLRAEHNVTAMMHNEGAHGAQLEAGGECHHNVGKRVA